MDIKTCDGWSTVSLQSSRVGMLATRCVPVFLVPLPNRLWAAGWWKAQSGNRLCDRHPREHAWARCCHTERVQLILTWQGRYHDQKGGSPIARLSHCTEAVADPCEFLKCGNLDCIISGSGGLRSRSPLIMLFKRNTSYESLHPTAEQPMVLDPSPFLQRQTRCIALRYYTELWVWNKVFIH